MHQRLTEYLSDITECYLEIMVRLLITNVVDISNYLGLLYQSYELPFTQCQKFKNLFLNYSIRNKKNFMMIIAHASNMILFYICTQF